MQILDVAISIIWSLYADKRYARHLFYVSPTQLADALKLNIISRCCCIISIAMAKISVAFLIERVICPPGTARPTSQIDPKKAKLRGIDWRRATLRGISGSVALSATITIILFYVQCDPPSALWDHHLSPPTGSAKCWNPIPVNTWDLVIASYWAFLDFVLALFPLPLILSLHLPIGRKLLLSLLLSMGIFAGAAAAIKTSKVPISVKGRQDITWQTVELLLWNGIEMNIIILAACIPTLRPVVLVLLRRPEARDLDDNHNKEDLGGCGKRGRGEIKHQERGQSYYPGQLDFRRRSSAQLGSTGDSTYHSAKSSSSPAKQQQQAENRTSTQQRSFLDSNTALNTTPSPSTKALEANVGFSSTFFSSSPSSHTLPSNTHISNRELITISSQPELHPQPLKIDKPFPALPAPKKPESNTDENNDGGGRGRDYWTFTLPPTGNSWRPSQILAQQPTTTTTQTSNDEDKNPDAITAAPLPSKPPPSSHRHYHLLCSSSSSSSSSSTPTTSPPPSSLTTRKPRSNTGLSAPLSDIGKPSPSPSSTRSRSLRRERSGTASSVISSGSGGGAGTDRAGGDGSCLS